MKNIYSKETISISKNDPIRDLKEWVGVAKKYLYIINENGKKEKVLIDDPRVQNKTVELI